MAARIEAPQEDQPDQYMSQSGPYVLQSGTSVIRWTLAHHLKKKKKNNNNPILLDGVLTYKNLIYLLNLQFWFISTSPLASPSISHHISPCTNLP